MKIFEIFILIIAILSCFIIIKAFLGPTLWDRLLCLSVLSVKITTAICLFAVIFKKSYYLDVALVFAILGFIGNVYISRYIKKWRSTND